MSSKSRPQENEGKIPLVYIVGIELSNSGDLGRKNANPHIIDYDTASTQYSPSRKYITDTRLNSSMKVEINMCLKKQNLLKYMRSREARKLKIAVVQSTSKRLTDLINSDPIMYLTNIAREEKRPGYQIKILSIADILPNNIMPHGGQTLINKYESNGLEQDLQIPFSKEPEEEGGSFVRDLSYFCYAFYDNFTSFYESKLDEGSISSYRQTRISKILSMGQVSSENVILGGRPVRKTFYFIDKDGMRWSGPVHQMRDGRWMKGARHKSKRSANLVKVNVDNIKVRDHRILNILKSLDLSFLKNDRHTTRNTAMINQARVNKSSDLFKKQNSTISEIYLSRDKGNRCRFMFSVNIEEIIRKNTDFPNFLDVIKHSNRRRYEALIRQAKIVSLRVSRNVVTKENYIGSYSNQQIISLSDSENTQVIAESKDEENGTGLMRTKNVGPRGDTYTSDQTNIKGTIGEVTGLRLNNSAGIRHFSGTDYDTSMTLGGLYQYEASIKILDPVFYYLVEKLELLDLIINGAGDGKGFEQYAREVNSNNRFNDEYLKRFKPGYLRHYNTKYVRGNSNLILNYIGSFVKIVFNLSGDALKKRLEPREATRYLANMCSANTGSPEGVLTVLELIKDFRASVHAIIAATNSYKKIRGTGDQTTERAPNMGATRRNGEYEERKVFKNLYDASIPTTVGCDYLSVSNAPPNSAAVGLTVMSKSAMKERFDLETKKYFKTVTPDITLTDSENNVLNPGDTINNTKFSYLSPSNINIEDSSGAVSISNLNRNVSSVSSKELNDALDKIMIYNKGRKTSFSKNADSTDKDLSNQKNLLDLLSYSGVTVEDVSSPTTRNTMENKIEAFDRTARADNINRDDALFEEIDSIDEEERNQFLNTARRLTRCLSVSKETNLLSKENSLHNFFLKNDRDTNRFTKKFIKAQNGQTRGDRGEVGNSRLAAKNPKAPLNSMPNQLKALLLSINKSTSINDNVVFEPVQNKLENSEDIFKNPENFGYMWFSYKNLKRIQVLRGFSKKNPDFINDPIWEDATEQDFHKSTADTLLIKIEDYEDETTDRETQDSLSMPVFDKYFLINPDNSKSSKLLVKALESREVSGQVDAYIAERGTTTDPSICGPGEELRSEDTTSSVPTNHRTVENEGVDNAGSSANREMIAVRGQDSDEIVRYLVENTHENIVELLPKQIRERNNDRQVKSNLEERARVVDKRTGKNTPIGTGATTGTDNVAQQQTATALTETDGGGNKQLGSSSGMGGGMGMGGNYGN